MKKIKGYAVVDLRLKFPIETNVNDATTLNNLESQVRAIAEQIIHNALKPTPVLSMESKVISVQVDL